MTSAEMLQELETKAWAQGRDAGLEQDARRTEPRQFFRARRGTGRSGMFRVRTWA